MKMNKQVMFGSMILIIIATLLIHCVAPERPCSETCIGCSSYGEFIRDSWARITGYILITFAMAWTVCSIHNQGDKEYGKKEEKM